MEECLQLTYFFPDLKKFPHGQSYQIILHKTSTSRLTTKDVWVASIKSTDPLLFAFSRLTNQSFYVNQDRPHKLDYELTCMTNNAHPIIYYIHDLNYTLHVFVAKIVAREKKNCKRTEPGITKYQ